MSDQATLPERSGGPAAGDSRGALYRFYDSRRELLYVGFTVEPWRRWREHVRTARWYPLAKHWTVTWYDSEPEALAAELRAIKGETPRFNIAGAPEPVPVRFVVREELVVVACTAWAALPMVLTVIVGEFARWHWLVAVTVGVALSSPVPWTLVVLTCFAPDVRRLATWVDRHVEHGGRDRGVVPMERRQA